MLVNNSSLGPPPLQTPISAQGPDQTGVPYQNRGLPSGNLAIGWAAWFSGMFQRIITLLQAYQAATILNGAITNVALALVVDSATAFPAAPFVAQIDSEQVNVTVKAGVNWTITRAANGTVATAHADNAAVTLKPIVTPGRLVKVEADGQVDESGISTSSVVIGAASLTDANRIVKVGATAGTLAESGVTDDGTTVYAAARDLGVGATAPAQVTAGRRYLFAHGDTHAGGLDFSQGDADANGVTVAIAQATDTNSTEADKRVAAIIMSLLGATANKRGGLIRFFTKTDNVSGLVQYFQIDDTGVTVVGSVNASGAYKIGGVAGLSVTITTAKLTSLGSNGSMTFTGGILTAQTQAT